MTARRRFLHRTAIGLAIVGAMTVAPAAWAGGHDEHGRDHHDGKARGHHHGRIVIPPPPLPFRAPALVLPAPRIVVHEHARRSPYWAEPRYYAPHRHAHRVEMVPVATPYGAQYRPRYYCGDRLFLDVAVATPHARLRIQY